MPALSDSDVMKLVGAELASQTSAGVVFRLGAVIGDGAHGIVFSALRCAFSEELPVVVKVLRPRAMKELAGLAGTAIKKEVAALMRLSEREPPAEFVVRFFDTGTLRIGESSLELPWIAMEYVQGGADGVTLSERVQRSIERSGLAFDRARACKAVRCIARGLTSIHEVGVIHRDVTPNNVLACGEGASEVFKISDFGLARVSETATFGDILLGTPGYSAPEQCFPDKVPVGPYTDVFGVACSLYWMLTGAHYFDVLTVPETFVAVQTGRRRALEGAALVPELRDRPELCRELERILARATSANPLERPSSPAELETAVLGLLSPVAS